MRLIDADAKELRQRININFGGVTRFIVKSILKDAPTIEAEPVKHGRWVRDLTYGGKHKEIYYCSLCHHWQANRKNREPGISAFHMRYCPNCGAKMDGGA